MAKSSSSLGFKWGSNSTAYSLLLQVLEHRVTTAEGRFSFQACISFQTMWWPQKAAETDVNLMPSQGITLFISHFLCVMLIQALKKHPANWCMYNIWSLNWLLRVEEYWLRNRKTICHYYEHLQASGSSSVDSNHTFIYSLLEQTSTRRVQK